MESIVSWVVPAISGPNPWRSMRPSLVAAFVATATPGVIPDVGAVDMGVMPVIAATVLFVLILWGAVTLHDRSRNLAVEEVALQARLSNVLTVERSLSGFPLTPTVRMPLFARGPVTVELIGSVSRLALRQAAVDLVLREVERTGMTCAVRDQIAVTPASLGRAA